MENYLIELLGVAAVEIAARQDIPIADAAQRVWARIPQLRAHYAAAGVPYGDDDVGFIQWLVIQALLDPRDNISTARRIREIGSRTDAG